MEALFFLVPLSVLVTAAAIAAFRWALRSGQMDDLDTPPVRILFDDADADPRLGAPTASRPLPSRPRHPQERSR